MLEVLDDLSRAGAKSSKRLSNELPALQQTDHVRHQFRRQEHPPCPHECKRSKNCARSGTPKGTGLNFLLPGRRVHIAVANNAATAAYSRMNLFLPDPLTCE